MVLESIMEMLSTATTSLSFGEIFASLFITLFLALFIFFVYRKTYSGVIYSRNFNLTLIIVSLVVTVVMLGISRNLVLSLGLIGALSIVRFRNAIKDSKDVAFLFWAISTGIVNGVQMYKLSILSALFIGGVLIISSKKFPLKSNNFVVVLKHNGLTSVKEINKLFIRYTKSFKMRNSTVSDDYNEFVYELSVKKAKEFALAKKLKQLKGVESVNLFSHTGDLME